MSQLEEWYGAAQRPSLSKLAKRNAAALALEAQVPSTGEARRVFEAWLDARSEDTIRSYLSDLETYALFVGASSPLSAMKHLLALHHGKANLLALEFRNDMRAKGRAPATVNRRLCALKSFTKAARTAGLIPWSLEVESLPVQQVRDTRGPGADGFRKLMEALQQRAGAPGARDRAVLRLLYERGLRSVEVRRLDLADVDLERGTLMVLGKGRLQKEPVSLAPSTTEALGEWVKFRGDQPGPLFTRFSSVPGRLGRQGIYRLVRELGEAVNIRARPHGLRHAAITEALDRGFDIREVQRFSRHRSVQTVIIYDDNRRDLGRAVAVVIASEAVDAPAPRPVPAPPAPTSAAPNRHAWHAWKKLTDDQVAELRQRYIDGERRAALAKAFGVSVSYVGFIVRGQRR